MADGKRLGYLMIVISSAGFAAIPTFGKWAYAYGATPTDVLTVRLIFGAVTLWTVVAFRYRRAIRFSRLQLLRLGGMALMGSVIGELCLFFAFKYIDVSLTLTIAFTSPMIVSLVSVPLFGERFSANKGLSLLITTMGAALAVEAYRPEFLAVNALGVSLAVGGCITWTFYMLIARDATRHSEPIAVTTMTLTMGSVLMVLAILATSGTELGDQMAVTLNRQTPWQVFAAGAAMATVSTAFPGVAFMAGIRRVGASRASIVAMVELPLTILMAVVFLGESLQWPQVLGIVAVLAGVGVIYWHREAREISRAPFEVDVG